MPGSRASVFGEAEDFQAALSADGVAGLLVTGRGQFRARLTQVRLDGWRLAAVDEEQPRIAFVEAPAGMVLASFPIGGEPSPIWAGIEIRTGGMITLGVGQRVHARTLGSSRWGAIQLPDQQLAEYGRVLSGAGFVVPPVARIAAHEGGQSRITVADRSGVCGRGSIGRYARSHRPRQDNPHRLSRRCSAILVLRQGRRAGGLYRRSLSGGRQELADQLHLASLDVAYVPVTSIDRFATIQQQKADLLCGPSTATLSRREMVGFSIPTFADGASLMIRADGPQDLKAMAGQKIGVLTNTTTEQELRDALQKAGITADVILVKTHSEGLALLDDGKISAYFADRSILVSLIKESKAPNKLMIAHNYLALEAYALALPRGDDDFRLAVDRALSHIYRGGGIMSIFKRTFETLSP